MSEIISAASPEVQAEALGMGWQPPEKFKGDPERFVDADEFVERGKTVLPIVKKQLADTRAEAAANATRLREVEAALGKANKALENIELENSVRTQKAVEAAKTELKLQYKQAAEAGDHEAMAEITGQMVELNAAPPPAKEEAKPQATLAQVDPVQAQWQSENTWFGTDPVKTSLMLGVGSKLRAEDPSLSGRKLLDAAKKETLKILGEADRADAVDKVADGRNGGGSDSSPTGKTSYQHLPRDAKEACDADLKRFVGAGKRYKTDADYRANWAQTYFSQER